MPHMGMHAATHAKELKAAAADYILLRGSHSCQRSCAGVLRLAWHPSVAS